MLYGYMRVSTQFRNEEYGKNQTFDRQELILKEYGVAEENIFRERISGGVSTFKRDEWERLMSITKAGDEIVVSEMSRLARSLQDLIETVNYLIKRGIGINFLKERIEVGSDGMNSMNKLMFSMFGAFAEFEKNIISERTKQGLQAKKSQGVRLGKPKKISEQTESYCKRLREQGYSYKDIGTITNISTAQAQRICTRGEQNEENKSK